MKFKPENGMKVLVRGDISVYEGSGQYQVYIKEMKTDGVGDLFVAYEQLKKKLEQEGLFSPKYKKPIPKYPKAVGIVTSPTGAAIRDILTTIKRRYPITKVLIFPALVQGEQGTQTIVQAIQKANERADVDVLIIGRGGGSIEELWNFNEEDVARAIFASDIPIISAVGHETDFTIADFVADMRAPTPTGAAELAVPHIQELLERVMNCESRLLRAMREKVVLQQERYQRLVKSYAFRYPRKLYEQKLEQVDKLTESLTRGTEKLYSAKYDAMLQLRRRLERSHPEELKKISLMRYQRATRALNRAITAVVSEKRKEFNGIISTLEALSPLKIMDRGYSLAYTEDGQLIKKIAQVKPERKIYVKLSDGSIKCVVTDIEESVNDGR